MDLTALDSLPGKTIADVITISDFKGECVILLMTDGSAVQIQEKRLQLNYVAEYSHVGLLRAYRAE